MKSLVENDGSVLVVIGLPGSGKSTYLNKLLNDNEVDVIYDDYQKGAPEENKSNPRLSPNYKSLHHDLKTKRRVAIADIRYCSQAELSKLQQAIEEDVPHIRMRKVYFENDVEACKHNVILRNRPQYAEKELAFIDEHQASYNPDSNHSIPVIMG